MVRKCFWSPVLSVGTTSRASAFYYSASFHSDTRTSRCSSLPTSTPKGSGAGRRKVPGQAGGFLSDLACCRVDPAPLDRECASTHFELFGMEAPDCSQTSPPACPGDFRRPAPEVFGSG